MRKYSAYLSFPLLRGFPFLKVGFFAGPTRRIGLALTGAVVGELVGASAGLGWYITNSLNVIDMTGAVTALIVMAVVAMLMYYAVLLIERRLLVWRPQAAR